MKKEDLIKIRPYTTNYPENEKISTNKITANCYKKIRECFKQQYIGKQFSNSLYPREVEFLQWIKKFLNVMEHQLIEKRGK